MQEAVTPASSLREAVDRLVKVSFDFNEADPDWVRLYFEFCLQAMRDPAAREVVSRSLTECRDVVAGMLKIGQPGAVRGDLDADAAATLLIALFDGIALHRAIAAEAVDLDEIAGPSGDLIELFVASNTNARPRQGRRREGGSR